MVAISTSSTNPAGLIHRPAMPFGNAEKFTLEDFSVEYCHNVKNITRSET